MKLIIHWYKLIAQAFKHQDLEKKIVQGILIYHFEKETFFFFFFNLEILERKKLGLFEKVTRKFNAPISKIFFFIENFSLFLERFGNLDFFFFFFFEYIHT